MVGNAVSLREHLGSLFPNVGLKPLQALRSLRIRLLQRSANLDLMFRYSPLHRDLRVKLVSH